MSGGYSETKRINEQGLIQELVQQEKQEEIVWQQKSWQLWLKEGDRNTCFFHRSTIQNCQHNKITHLKYPTCQVVEKQSELEQQLIQFYLDLLK